MKQALSLTQTNFINTIIINQTANNTNRQNKQFDSQNGHVKQQQICSVGLCKLHE